MKRDLSKIKYQNFKEVIDDEVDNLLIDSNDDFFTYPSAQIHFLPNSSRITIHLSGGEINLLIFIIKSLDGNFQFRPNKIWKESFSAYVTEMGYSTPPKDITIRKSISKIKKLKGLISLPGENRIYMINPFYFSRSDLNRKEALRFLLNARSLKMIPRRTLKGKGFQFDAAETSKKIKPFTLLPYEYNRLRRVQQLKQFEEEFDKKG